MLLALAAVVCTIKYEPIIDSDRNRSNFYLFEKRIAAEENKKVPAKGSSTLRITHFDSHWHGMNVNEFVKIAEDTQSNVIVARGVPEREGYEAVVRSTLITKGFHPSSVVRGPCASLPSGIVIGVRGCELDSTKTEVLGLEDGTAGWQIAVSAKDPLTDVISLYYLLIATLDPFDAGRRSRQMSLLHRRVLHLDQKGAKFFLLGGFYSEQTSYSVASMNYLGLLQNAFTLTNKALPTHTSWSGIVSDTAYVSRHAYNDVKDVSVWHAENLDCLPILLDIGKRAALASSPHPPPSSYSPPQPTWTQKITSWMRDKYHSLRTMISSVNWKIVGVIVLSIVGIVLLVLVLRLSMNRKHDRKIQGTAAWTDSDLKIVKKSVAENYPDEKSRV